MADTVLRDLTLGGLKRVVSVLRDVGLLLVLDVHLFFLDHVVRRRSDQCLGHWPELSRGAATLDWNCSWAYGWRTGCRLL